MWWWMLLIGFVIANVPPLVYQRFDGLAFFGLVIVLFSALKIVMKEMDRV